MYHATGTHEAIIDMDTFNKVQRGMKSRAEHFKHKEGEDGQMEIVRGGDGAPYLPAVHAGADALRHRKVSDG